MPEVIHSKGPNGEKHNDYVLREDLHNGRPAWDLSGSLHHSLCWTPFDNNADFGFWALANLWTRDEKGQATGIVFQTRPSGRTWTARGTCRPQQRVSLCRPSVRGRARALGAATARREGTRRRSCLCERQLLRAHATGRPRATGIRPVRLLVYYQMARKTCLK